jgi:hypothetical protein
MISTHHVTKVADNTMHPTLLTYFSIYSCLTTRTSGNAEHIRMIYMRLILYVEIKSTTII